MEELIERLKRIKDGVDFSTETELFDDGFLDSFDVIRIIKMIDEEYDVQIPPAQIVPENFNSAEAIYEMIKRLED